MTGRLHNLPSDAARRRAFSLVEVLVSSLIVGLMIVGALKSLGSATRGALSASQQGLAAQLAAELMAEIQQAEYRDPDGEARFGPETNEDAGNRSQFDDVDDYHGWTASPPEAKDGTTYDLPSGIRRTVSVQHVDPDSPATPLADGDDRGLKRIRVVVSRDNVELARLDAWHSSAWRELIPDPGNDTTTGSSPPANQPPVAQAAGAPLTGEEPLSVSFDGGGSTDPDGDGLVYTWDFGDGAAASGPQVSHTFDEGSFTVTLTVQDGNGGQSVDTLTVNAYD